jgi:hypothetical protein
MDRHHLARPATRPSGLCWQPAYGSTHSCSGSRPVVAITRKRPALDGRTGVALHSRHMTTFTVASNEFIGGGKEKAEYHPVVTWV